MRGEPSIRDKESLASWLSERDAVVEAKGVAKFVPGPGVCRLPDLRFDLERLRAAVDEAVKAVGYDDSFSEHGFGVLPLTRRPGTSGSDPVDLSGRFWIRPDDSYEEIARDPVVDEFGYTEFVPELAHTYFAEVHQALTSMLPIGRMRLNSKAIFNCNSWHRDPEPRLHIPIYTNPGSLFVVNHHCTHLPADGSVYFTDTRGYHTALNGGDHPRVHLVAALPTGGTMP